MKFFLPVLLLFSVLSLGVSNADETLSPEMYWEKVLPNYPMPKAVRDSLNSEKKGTTVVDLHEAYATGTQLQADPNAAIIFLQKDLKPGYKITLQFLRSTKNDVATFLPRHIASSIPFSSSDFPAILRRFSISPESDEATIMKQTITKCERNAATGKYCATSLESMVDFAVSILGSNERSVKAVSTDASSDDGRKKEFTVTAIRDVATNGGEGVVPCHKVGYPYAVFYCHNTTRTVAYTVELEAEGNVVKATAVCHKDKSEWSSENLVVKLLKVKSGTVPICHFLPQDDVVWVQN